MAKFISRLKDISGKFNAGVSTEPVDTPKIDKQPDNPEKVDKQTLRRRREIKRSLLRMKRFSVQQLEVIKKPFTGENPLHHKKRFWIGLGVGGGAIALGVAWSSFESSLPDTGDVLTLMRPETLTIKASNGKILQQIGPTTREALKIDKIPKKLIQAFIAIEDRRFYQHQGVDYQGVGRAIVSNLVARDVVEGASTITQQLARMVFLDQERSVWRKLKEVRTAQKIENGNTKDQILERYLNLVYLGEGAYGVADAAWVYFTKPVYELTLAEMATLAAIPPAPNEYSPLKNPQVIKERRNLVLKRMQEGGFITAEEADKAIASPLITKASPPKRLERFAPYFTEYIQQELPKYVSKQAREVGGLTVETSLHPEWQESAEEAVKKTIENTGRGQNFEQAALVAIDPRTGEIKAMVGGKDFFKQQFNRVTQAQRQPGSTFKAFVYATAMAAGFTPYRGYLDSPYKVDGYSPKNYSETHRGWISMRDALISSINVVAVKVLVDVGWEPTIQLARKMGIESELKPTYSTALGASEVNLLELTSAYGTFATNGTHTKAFGIRRVLDRRGNVIYNAKSKSERVLQEDTSAIMTWLLRGVVNEGTGQAASLGDRPVAGKTGTSDEARDLWFIGYIPQMVAGVWLGNDNNKPTWGASTTAAYTWHEFMEKVVEGMPIEKFPPRPTELEGRKPQIEVKPIKPRSSYSGPIKTDKSDNDEQTQTPRRRRSRRTYSEDNSSNETPRRSRSRSNTYQSNSVQSSGETRSSRRRRRSQEVQTQEVPTRTYRRRRRSSQNTDSQSQQTQETPTRSNRRRRRSSQNTQSQESTPVRRSSYRRRSSESTSSTSSTSRRRRRSRQTAPSSQPPAPRAPRREYNSAAPPAPPAARKDSSSQ
ncbi:MULTISPECIES: PBP1A family penicillin-binding protein [Cyanophyceae]|uniref:PBP1A family penicillin-binding protein n=1 Tax=Cyanophyceae TaxID=3028117 RepID=UPI0018F02AC6